MGLCRTQLTIQAPLHRTLGAASAPLAQLALTASFVLLPAVYLALRLALTRLHGGSLHAHQPLRTHDEEWPAAEAERGHSGRLSAGTIKLDGLPINGGLNGGLSSNGHADRWAPAKSSVQLADL